MSVLIVEKLSRKLLAGLLLMMMAMALALRSRDSAFAASNGRMGGSISNSYSSSDSSSYFGSSSCCCYQHLCPEDYALTTFITTSMTIIFIYVIYLRKQREIGQGSVLMLQVGILDKKRVLQRKLNTIAESADTSTSRGLSQLLDEVSYALLQHHDSCHFVYFLERCNHSMEDSLVPFYRQLKITERKRYDRETFMNVNGVKLERPSAIEVNSIDNEYSVVTVLVLASGRYDIPSLTVDSILQTIYDIPSLTVDSILQTIYSIPREKLKAVEVLWSPQSEGDTISKQELRRDFPHMRCYDKKKKFHKFTLPPAIKPMPQ